MTHLNKHQALALNTILKKTADIYYHLVTVEADVQSIRAALDTDTNIITMPIHSAMELRMATDGLKLAEQQAREHMSEEPVDDVERLITEARRRGMRFSAVHFCEGIEA